MEYLKDVYKLGVVRDTGVLLWVEPYGEQGWKDDKGYCWNAEAIILYEDLNYFLFPGLKGERKAYQRKDTMIIPAWFPCDVIRTNYGSVTKCADKLKLEKNTTTKGETKDMDNNNITKWNFHITFAAGIDLDAIIASTNGLKQPLAFIDVYPDTCDNPDAYMVAVNKALLGKMMSVKGWKKLDDRLDNIVEDVVYSTPEGHIVFSLSNLQDKAKMVQFAKDVKLAPINKKNRLNATVEVVLPTV